MPGVTFQVRDLIETSAIRELAGDPSIDFPQLSSSPANKSTRQGDNRAAVPKTDGLFRKITIPFSPSAPRRAVRLLPAERAVLERLTRSRTQPHRYVVRSQIVLMANDGASVARIASAIGVARSTVRRWCRRFADGGVRVLLAEAPGRGRPPGIDRRVALGVLRALRQTAGGPSTIRSLAARAGTSASRTWRILERFNLRVSSSIETIDAAIERVISETENRR